MTDKPSTDYQTAVNRTAADYFLLFNEAGGSISAVIMASSALAHAYGVSRDEAASAIEESIGEIHEFNERLVEMEGGDVDGD